MDVKTQRIGQMDLAGRSMAANAQNETTAWSSDRQGDNRGLALARPPDEQMGASGTWACSRSFPPRGTSLAHLNEVFSCKFFARLRASQIICNYFLAFSLVACAVSVQSRGQFPPIAMLPTRRNLPQCFASRANPDDLSSQMGSGPENGEISASYARFSSKLQRDEGIPAQQRKCREFATPTGHHIASELEFSDYAVSGTKRDRKGLDQLREAARQGKFRNLYFYSLSRLARGSVIAMPFLKELVHVHKIRVFSVTEGLDSARQGWETVATFLCMQHERYIQDLSANVQRGQEVAVLANYSVGAYSFGYTSVPDPNGAVVGCGRNTKPRMVYAIDPNTSVWVQRIFLWFAIEKRSLSSIVRELNRHGAPKDHRSTVPAWTQQHLLALLKNPKYVGIWPWGEKRNVRNPLTGQLHQEDRPSEETAKWTRNFPHLRLVTDELHEIACQRLAENGARYAPHRDRGGRLRGSKPGNSSGQPRHMLSGLIRCGHCPRDTRFYVVSVAV